MLNHDALVAIIADTESLSEVVDIGDALAISIHMPAAWTAANLTFQASFDGTTFNDVYDDAGNEVTVTADAERAISILSNYLTPYSFIKIRSGTSDTPVAQAATRMLVIEAKR